MKDKFSLYQADGFWGIIEDASDEKQTSVKSYIGPDLIVKRLNEQADQIDQLKQQLEEKDKEIEKLKQQYTILDNENGKLTTELIMGKYKKAQKEVSFGMQLAIQELEKTLNFIEDVFDKALKNCSLNNGYYDQILDFIDQQIKELKGE